MNFGRPRGPVGTIRAAFVMSSVICLGARAGDLLMAQTREAIARPASGSAVVAGTVTTDDSQSLPIRRATVTLSGGATGPVQAVTDDTGRFTFAAIPASTYTVTVEKPGYVKTFYGSRRPGRGPGMPIAVADAQRVTLALKLLRGAVIAGTVVDHDGRPAASTQITVLQPQMINGERKLVAPATALPMGHDGRSRPLSLLRSATR